MKRAFTLLELVAVLAIVAVLLALAVPALHFIKAQGASTKCLSNLRGLGVALNAYLADHDYRMPALRGARASRAEDVPVVDTVLAPYVDDPRAFACPADHALAERTGTSYFWDVALNDQSAASLNFLKIFELKGSIPVLSDKEGWHTHQKKKVNILFADGHAGKNLQLVASP